MIDKYLIYIVAVGASVCLFCYDWIMRLAAKDDSFIKLEKSGETLKSVFYIILMFAGPYWGMYYLMHEENIMIQLGLTCGIGLVLFLVEFFLVKRGIKALCVVPLTLIAAAEAYYVYYEKIVRTPMKMLVFTGVIAGFTLFIVFSYSAAKSKVSVFRSGKVLTFIACFVSSLFAGIIAGFVIESCVLSVPSLFR